MLARSRNPSSGGACRATIRWLALRNTLQDGYAAAKIDGSAEKQRKIQILDADTFVSGTWAVTSGTIPANTWTLRCTDVYEKSVAGTWPIANEHCSNAPTG